MLDECGPSCYVSTPRRTFEVVRIKQVCAFQKQETYYNLRWKNWKPRVEEFVWRRDYPLSNKAAGFNAKCPMIYQVARSTPNNIVNLRNAQRRWHVHVQDLKSASAMGSGMRFE